MKFIDYERLLEENKKLASEVSKKLGNITRGMWREAKNFSRLDM